MRKQPQAGEIWQHYKGEEIRILGVLRNGNREDSSEVIAYELINQTDVNPTPRYYRTPADFMSEVNGKPRFTIVEDIDGDIWARSLELII
jgi:hypothetical protein